VQETLTKMFALVSIGLLLTACQTTKRSGPPVSLSTICAALQKGDPLKYLTDEDKALVRERFSREGKDGQKMNRAIMREIGC
jgi:hypothetical protein